MSALLPVSKRRLLLVGAILTCLPLNAPSTCWAVDVLWNQSIDSNYANPDNWDGGFRPAFFLNEVGVIGSSSATTATANVSSSVLDNPGGVVLGQSSGSTGTLNMQNNGVLTVQPGTQATGDVVVGASGTGILNLLSGSILSGDGLTLASGTGSQINASGTATAQFNSDATLGGLTQITGPAVDFSIGGNLVFGSGGTLLPEITGPSHSAIAVAGAATLGGTLELAFNGHTPIPGESWDLVDASSFAGGFAAITAPGVALDPGQQFVVQVVADGSSTYGQVARLSIAQSPVSITLQVDPTTGRGLLFNDSDLLDVDIIGYDIFSFSGSLLEADGQWNSLDDQNVEGGDWRESNVSMNRLAELKEAGATTLGASGSTVFDLGVLFDATGGTQDLMLNVLLDGASTPSFGTVVYEPIAPVLVGDYNEDDIVNLADYTVWRDNLGAPAGTLPNDTTGVIIGSTQYVNWKNNFGMSSAAGMQFQSVSVPEPTSLVLVVGLLALAAHSSARYGT